MVENVDEIVLKLTADSKQADKTIEELSSKIEALSKIKLNLLSSGKSRGGFIEDELKQLASITTKMATLNQTLDLAKFASNFQKVSKKVDETTDSLEKNAKALEKTENELKKTKKATLNFSLIWKEMTDNIGKRLSIYYSYKMINEITNAFSSSLQQITSLQKEFANIQAITASTDGVMMSLVDTIHDVGTNSMFTNQELAKATVTLGQAGYSAQEIEKLLESVSQLAAATGTDLSTSVQVATSALTVWNLEASQMTRVADVLTSAVNATKAEIATIANGIQYAGAMFADLGVSLEESVALFSAVTNAGLKARSVVGTGSRALVTELITPTEKFEKVLKRLNLTLDDVDVRSKGVTLVLQTLRDAGFGAEEAFEAMDRRAATFYSAASSQLEMLKQLNKEFLLTGATSKANETQMKTLYAQMVRFKNVFIETTYEALLPLTNGLTLFFEKLNDIFTHDAMKGVLVYGAQYVVTFKMLIPLLKQFTPSFKAAVSSIAAGAVSLKNFAAAAVNLRGAILSLDVALGVLKGSLSGLKKLLATSGFILLVSGLQMAFTMAGKAKARLQTLESETASTQTKIDSINDSFEELINKAELYENDSESLSLRIAQLNKQFEYSNQLLLQQGDSYDTVLTKLSKYKFAVEAQQAAQYKEQAKQRREVATRGSWYEPFFGRTRAVKKYIDGKSLEELDEAYYVDKISFRKAYFDKVRELDDKESLRLQEQINQMEESSLKEEKLKIIIEARRSKLNEEYAKALELSSKLGEEMSFEAQSTRAWMNRVKELHKETVDKMMKDGVELPVEEIFGEVDLTTRSLESSLDEVKRKRDKILKDNPILKKIPNELVNMLNSIINAIEAEIRDVTDKTLEMFDKTTKSVLKKEQDTFKDTVKMTQGGFLPKDTSVSKLKTSLDDYKKALKDRQLFEQKALLKEFGGETDSAAYNAELSSLNRKFTEDLVRAEVETETVLFKLNGGLEKLTEAVDEAADAMNEIKDEFSMRKTSLRGKLGVTSLEAKVSGFSEGELGGGPEETLMKLELEKAELYYKERALELDEQQVSKLKEQKEKNEILIETLKNRVSLYAKEKKNHEGLSGDYARWEEAGKKLETSQKELLKMKKTQRSLTKEILDLETEITYQKEEQRWREFSDNTSNKNFDFKGSMKAGAAQYLEDNKTAAKNLNSALSQLTNSGLQAFETSFTSFTQSVINNSESVSDAFRNMARNVLQTMSDLLIQMAVKYAIMQALGGFMSPGTQVYSSPNAVGPQMPSTYGPHMYRASGGPVVGGVPNRDSVPTMLMPGEYVMKKSAVSALGENFLTNLNNNTVATMNAMNGGAVVQNNEPSVVNVWVVTDKEQAQMGPNDVIATISKDIRTGGTTKKLIQSVVAGRKA